MTGSRDYRAETKALLACAIGNPGERPTFESLAELARLAAEHKLPVELSAVELATILEAVRASRAGPSGTVYVSVEELRVLFELAWDSPVHVARARERQGDVFLASVHALLRSKGLELANVPLEVRPLEAPAEVRLTRAALAEVLERVDPGEPSFVAELPSEQDNAVAIVREMRKSTPNDDPTPPAYTWEEIREALRPLAFRDHILEVVLERLTSGGGS